MKLTKYAHACVALEDNGTTIVIDPGVYTPDTDRILADAEAVLITHEHSDHIDKDALTDALAQRPELEVYGPQAVIDLLGAQADRLHAVKEGDTFDVGPFHVAVYGRDHAVVHPDRPTAANVCYLVNGTVFHPGDSFTEPGVPVEVLLLPTSGPWLKIGEVVDYVRAIKPNRLIEIHERINSDLGAQLAQSTLGENGLTGIKLEQLKHGESTEV